MGDRAHSRTRGNFSLASRRTPFETPAPMPAEAHISTTWKRQKLLVGIFVIAFGGYFFFDGFINWPKSNVRWLKHKEFVDAQNEVAWDDYAAKQGWTNEVPHKFYEPKDIVGQYVCGSVLVLIGGIVLVYWATQIKRVVRTDEDAVYTAAGNRVPFSAITGVGKKQWESKGIARVRYELDGRRGEFVVDDYKFDTEPSRTILKEIEEKLIARPGGEAKAV